MDTITLAETIRTITRRHLLENNGVLLGQSISAVGWVNGTVPDVKGIIELPMTDVAGAGIAVGAAMVGRRPIFVLRFQDFLILNGSPLINYAAKTKELHGRSTPIFIRALASEGLGPVHSGVLHSVYMHFPGFRICAPMTPGEYEDAWQTFMAHDDPMLVSEHRDSFANTCELPDTIHVNAHITIFGISISRFAMLEAAAELAREGIICNCIHVHWLKPFTPDDGHIASLRISGLGLVIDPGYEICGAARSIAYELTTAAGVPVRAMGLGDHTKCLCAPFQNKAPDGGRIALEVRRLLAEYDSAGAAPRPKFRRASERVAP
jgi:pyruvate/2-oxoglutarate/acetoin dehydrogenase E1 component